jgi:hypothetical protein
VLNTTDAVGSAPTYWNSTTATSTEFSLGTSSQVNFSGHDYVAYLFAHDAGGFGLSGTENVISCGSFTTNAAGWGSATLGYEPQWFLWKNITNADDWYISDTMRGQTTGSTTSVSTDPNTNTVWLKPSSSAAEVTNYPTYATKTQSQGFTYVGGGGTSSSSTYIYIAIRRGPMKTPTTGTQVFNPQVQTTTGSSFVLNSSSGFPVDWLPNKQKNNVIDWYATNRLTNNYLSPNTTASQGAFIYGFDLMQGVSAPWDAASIVSYAFRRAPGVFDIVSYTGTGANTTFTHNLGVAPELMIIKSRSDAFAWRVYTAPTGNTGYMVFNANDAFGTSSATWNNTSPTSSVFTVGTPAAVNNYNSTFVAYLFASVAGVSKVGSYTGTGSTLTVDCGFPSGVRFVMVKRTNNLGSWWVWDTARGMVAGTDPRLAFDSTSAETNTNWVYSVSTGFQVVSTNSEVNSSGDTYIFLAIA